MDVLFLLTIVPAYLVGSFFVKHDPGPPEPKAALHSAIWFGAVAVIGTLLISIGLDLFLGDFQSFNLLEMQSLMGWQFFGGILIFALVEEALKFIPIAIFLIKKPFFNEFTDGIIYFSIVGLTFGAIESFLYGLGSGDLAVQVVIFRLVLGLFFHGALTSVVGYTLVRSKLLKARIASVVATLTVISVLHAGYNYAVFESSGRPLMIGLAALIALAVNIMMFWLFLHAIKNDIRYGIIKSHR